MSEANDNYPGTFAATNPDKPAVIMAESGQVVTYGELDEIANRLSQLFRAAGLEPGDHMAFCMENRPEFLPIMWGAHYAGLYYTAVSSRLTTEEIAYIIEDSGSKAFITSPYMAESVAGLGDALNGLDVKLSVGGALDGFDSFEDAIARHPDEALPNRREAVPMLYSSGTTGRPKGVKPGLPDAPLGEGEPLMMMVKFLFGASDESTYLSPAPLYHSAPLRYCASFHRIGATVVVMERFDAEGALAAIEKYRATHSQWVPTMFVRMLKLPEETRARYDVSSLTFAVHAAAPCPVGIKRQMFDWWGEVIHEYYAGTEGNGFVYCNPADWLAHPGSVGKPINCTVHIVNDDGEEVSTGEEGTVYFEGTSLQTFEYHNDPEKTKGAMLGSWSTLGDIGKLDEDGFLYLTDRKANMIISGGVNIYPQETENVLTVHPKVHDVAVFGVPNTDFGEEVKAVVQPVDMAEAGDTLERELIEYCREHLADVKCPRSVDFREELPRHPTGKLYKRLLKDEYWKGHDTRLL
ncbi:MAG: acyl-CoA synthetase [Myxococcota bacterium]|jgi:acyl-CoA synthetase (AMP-forming)/AMP-acid ligase II|nr:acyl-CoA synthetase [Myxococcota bacterium]